MSGGWAVPGYTHFRELGLGISGRVMLAEQERTGDTVAIKYLSRRLCADQVFLRRLRTGTRLLAGLDDPHVVRLHEYAEGPRTAAIVLELVDGITLQHVIGAESTIGPQAALMVLKRSLRGLAAAHQIGVVHGGYKPTNVLIGADGASRLTDFAIAGPGLFGTGVPVYLAPERWEGRPATPAADIYAATAVFHECLTGHPPYEGKTTALLGEAHRSTPIPVHQAPEALRGLLARGLAKDPADRPPVAAFLADLEEVATAAYGPGWERQGRDRLAELATPLAHLFPLARPLHPAATRPTTRAAIMIGLRQSWIRAAVGAVLIGLLTGGSLLLTADRQPQQEDGSFTVHRVVPEPSTNPSPTLTPAAATESNRKEGPRRVVPRSRPAHTMPDSRTATPTPTPTTEPPGDGTTGPTGEPSGDPHADPAESPIIEPSISLGPPSRPGILGIHITLR